MARCKTVTFKGRKRVRFCAKNLSPKKAAAKRRRGRAKLKKFACKAAGAPRAACAALGA